MYGAGRIITALKPSSRTQRRSSAIAAGGSCSGTTPTPNSRAGAAAQ
jgi:hypothetical protein